MVTAPLYYIWIKVSYDPRKDTKPLAEYINL